MKLAITYQVDLPDDLSEPEQDQFVRDVKKYVPDTIYNCAKVAFTLVGRQTTACKVSQVNISFIRP